MKKSIITRAGALVMAGLMTFGLAACGGGASEGSTGSDGDVTGSTFKVGIIQFVDDASLNQIEENIEKELEAKGKELGVTFEVDLQNGQADGTVLNQMAAQMVSDHVDVIVPIATPAAQIVQSATEDDPIPVVFSAVSDPVGAKLAASMDKPGANITGTSDALNTNAIMDLICAQNPDVKYVGLLYSKSEDASTQPIKDAKAYLDKKGIKYIEKTGTKNDEVMAAADALIAEKVDAIFTPTDNTIMTAELSIYEKLAEAGIPHYCGADSFALNGAFCGYGVDYANLGKETADMIVEILVNGADPATTPIRTFDNGIACVNTEVCESLGYKLDDVKAAFKPFCTEIREIKTAENFE
ncbi:MAG: ABC transporter substrate-binding protein [Eubacterium sp.]|nr:ABC transporter substrate-binding protein [Eubacterium sp.]